jgi:uncharacterized delta-60 repeat protein
MSSRSLYEGGRGSGSSFFGCARFLLRLRAVPSSAARGSGGDCRERGLSCPVAQDRHGRPWGRTKASLDLDFTAGLIQPDGKIVVVASDFYGSSTLARYGRNGRLDRSFGTGGTVANRWGPVTGVALQSDDKIVVAGAASHPERTADLAVARYLPDGRLDTDFGTGGNVVTDFGSGSGSAAAIAIRADGKIVVAGSIRGRIALARYMVDGRFDASFGRDGKVVADFGPIWGDSAQAVVIQDDGKIVAGGSHAPEDQSEPIDEFLALVRYTSDGTLDSSFGTGGKVLNKSVGPVDGLVLQRDGKLVATAKRSPLGEVTHRPVLTRYTADGRLDRGFGNRGHVSLDLPQQ